MATWKYDGFISYSTRADGDLAPRIQDGLERLAKPWNRRRALSIFQDTDDLAATADLSATLRSELTQSQTMVFLASPESAASAWCNDELSYWIGQRPPNELVVVLTGGTLEFDKDAEHPTRFETSTAAPPAFAALTSVPLYIDMRYDDADVESMDVRRDAEFRAKLTKISAAIHSNREGRDVQPRDIDSKDLAEHRKAQRIRTIAIVLLAVLTVLAVWFALDARAQRQVAQSEALAARAELELERDPLRAASLALEARDAATTAEADRAIVAVAASPWLATLAAGGSTISTSADGSRVLVSGNDGWDLFGVDGAAIAAHDMPPGTWAGSSLLAPAGDRILMLRGEGGATLFDDGGTVLASFGGEDWFDAAAFSPDGRAVALGGSGARVWDVAALEADESSSPVAVSNEFVTSVAFGPDGATVLTGEGPVVRIWSLEDDRVEELLALDHRLSVVQLTVTSEWLLSTVEYEEQEFAEPPRVNGWAVSLTGVPSATPLFSTQLGEDDGPVAVSDDGGHMVVGRADGTAEVRTTTPPEGSCGDTLAFPARLLSLGRHDGPVTAVAFVPGADRVLTVGAFDTRLWSVDGVRVAAADAGVSQRRATLARSDGRFTSAAVSPDGDLVLASGATSMIWDPASGDVTTLGEACYAAGLAEVSDDGTRLLTLNVASGERGTVVEEWDRGGNQLRRLDLEGIDTVTYADGDGSLVVAAQGGVAIWDPSWSASNEVTVLSEPAFSVTDLAAADAGAELRIAVVVADRDGVRIHDRGGRLVAELVGHDGPVVSVSADRTGTRFVTAGIDRTARVWSTTGEQLALLSGHRLPLTSAEFDPTGERVVTASADGTVRVWDLSGEQIAVMSDHFGEATSAAFSPDGTLIVSTGDDRTVRLWRWEEPSSLVGTVSARLPAAGP